MPHSDDTSSPACAELGAPLSSFVEHLDVREVLRKLLQIGKLEARVGLPRRGASEAARPFLGGTHVLIEVTGEFDALAFSIALPVAQALGVIERMLGSPDSSAVPSRAGAPNAAECGVLAYLAARVCASASPTLQIRDVRCVSSVDELMQRSHAAIWPTSLRCAALQVDAKLLFADTRCLPSDLYTVELALTDDIDANDLAALEVGDVLYSDSWPSTLSLGGIHAPVQVTAVGAEERARGTLSLGEIGELRVESARKAPRAELVIARFVLDFSQLTELVSGSRHRIEDVTSRTVELRVDGQAYATGSLVAVHQTIGLRVESLTRHSLAELVSTR